MGLRQARKFFDDNYDELRDIFYSRYESPSGGLLNAKVVSVDSLGHLEIRCHYDGYNNADDRWTWFLDPAAMKFYC